MRKTWRTILGGDHESQSKAADSQRWLPDHAGYKPVRKIHKAASAGHTAMVKDLLPRKGVNCKDKKNRLPNKPATDEPGPSSKDDDYNFDAKDKVTLKTSTPTKKTSENQTWQVDPPSSHLQETAQGPEMNEKCDRKDTSVRSRRPTVQKREEMLVRQRELEREDDVQLATKVFTWRVCDSGEKFKIKVCLKIEPLHDNSKGRPRLEETPSNSTNNMLDSEQTDESEGSASGELQTFHKRKDPSLENVFPSPPCPRTQGSTDQSSEVRDKVTLKTSTPTKKTSETQTWQVDPPSSHLQETAQGPEVNEKCDRKDTSVRSRRPTVQKREEMLVRQGELEREDDVQLATKSLKRRVRKICEKFKTNVCPKMEPRHDNSKGRTCLEETPSKSTSNMLDREQTDELEGSASGVLLTFHKQKDPSLENVFPSPPCPRTQGSRDQSSSEVRVEEKGKSRKNNEFWKISAIQNSAAATATVTTAATAHSEDGSMLQRKSGKTKKQQLPIKENEEHDNSAPALNRKEVKKSKSEKWTSSKTVTTPMFEKPTSVTGGLPQVKDVCTLSEVDQDEGRPAKKKSKEKHKVRKERNAVEDTEDITQLSLTAYSDSLLTLLDAVTPCEGLTKLKSTHRELLIRKIENIENKLNRLQKMLSEINELKSQLDHEKVQWEELYNLRFPLKEEKKRESLYQQFKNFKIHLRIKKKKCNEDIDVRQLETSLGKLCMEMKAIKLALKELQNARDQHTKTAESADKMLKTAYSEVKVAIKMQTEKTKQLQKDLLQYKKEQRKRLTELLCLEQEKKKNEESAEELTRLKKLFKRTTKESSEHENTELSVHGDLKTNDFEMDIAINMLRHEINDLKEKSETVFSELLCLDVKLERIEQELSPIQAALDKYQNLDKNQKKLEEEVLNLKTRMQENTTQAANQEHFMKLRHNLTCSINQLKLRHKYLQYENSQMKIKQDSVEIELEKYKQLYAEKCKLRYSLSKKLNETTERLKEAEAELLLKKEQNRVRGAHSARPVLQRPLVADSLRIAQPQFHPERRLGASYITPMACI